MLFPELKNRPFGYLNLDLAAREWSETCGTRDRNRLLNPRICALMVEQAHAERGLAFSYGGWLEDRRFLWAGSYLEAKGAFTHLGLDVNAPAGTEIAASFEAEVAKIDDDPEVGGWGPRIILRHLHAPICMIYAHLHPEIGVDVGDRLDLGQAFCRVGEAPGNGNWFPHLHLQVLSASHFGDLEDGDGWRDLDGYGRAEDRARDAMLFPDPLRYVRLV